MIRSFNDKSLKLYFEKGDSSKLRQDLIPKIQRVLSRLDATKEIRDMNAPGLKLHPLKGNREGTWAIWVSGNWRITFRLENENVFDVKLEDYH